MRRFAHRTLATALLALAVWWALPARPAWRRNPSAGFREAFDVIVHTRAAEVDGVSSRTDVGDTQTDIVRLLP